MFSYGWFMLMWIRNQYCNAVILQWKIDSGWLNTKTRFIYAVYSKQIHFKSKETQTRWKFWHFRVTNNLLLKSSVFSFVHVWVSLSIYPYEYILDIGGFQGDPVVKNLPASDGAVGSIPGSRRSSGGGNGNSLQYSCLENPMDREARWATVHRVTKSRKLLND